MAISNIEYNGKDQNWQGGATTYWFTFEQGGKENKYGVVESGTNEPAIVDQKGFGALFWVGEYDYDEIREALVPSVTDEMRVDY